MLRELSDEAKEIWDNLQAYEEILNPVAKEAVEASPPVKPPRLSKEARELFDIKMELVKMINNSNIVIRDCDTILAKCRSMEEYIVCDAKVAKTLHIRLVSRLERILAGLPAFEDESHLTVNIEEFRRKTT